MLLANTAGGCECMPGYAADSSGARRLALLHVELQYVQRQRHVHCMQRWDRGYTDLTRPSWDSAYPAAPSSRGVPAASTTRHVQLATRPTHPTALAAISAVLSQL